jgi:hypothetical protein
MYTPIWFVGIALCGAAGVILSEKPVFGVFLLACGLIVALWAAA